MHEAKTHLSCLVEQVGKPMGRATSIETPESTEPLPSRLGLLEGHCSVPNDFDRLSNEAIADLFEGP
jgi:hypothetical protein